MAAGTDIGPVLRSVSCRTRRSNSDDLIGKTRGSTFAFGWSTQKQRSYTRMEYRIFVLVVYLGFFASFPLIAQEGVANGSHDVDAGSPNSLKLKSLPDTGLTLAVFLKEVLGKNPGLRA